MIDQRRSAKIAAIIPAAGRSERMGRPKLTLPIAGDSVIARVVSAFSDAGVNPIVVVAPPKEIDGSRQIIEEAQAGGAFVVVPENPTPDMRSSVEFGLRALGREFTQPVAVLIAPGDSPGLSSEIIIKVIDHFNQFPSIVAPTRNGKRGHPLLLPWKFAQAIFDLPPDVGVNALLSLHLESISELSINDPGAFEDMDTPDDYRKWREAIRDPSQIGLNH